MLKIQEFIIIPKEFDTFSEALIASTSIYKRLKELITERYGKLYTALGDEGGVVHLSTRLGDALDRHIYGW